jgi:hypothetical protein
MDSNFETGIYPAEFYDPTIQMVNLGVLTEKEYWTTIDIATRMGYVVFGRPINAKSGDRTDG